MTLQFLRSKVELKATELVAKSKNRLREKKNPSLTLSCTGSCFSEEGVAPRGAQWSVYLLPVFFGCQQTE